MKRDIVKNLGIGLLIVSVCLALAMKGLVHIRPLQCVAMFQFLSKSKKYV